MQLPPSDILHFQVHLSFELENKASLVITASMFQ